jgi:hypothetical protein
MNKIRDRIKQKKVLNIGFIGVVQHIEQDKKLLLKFKNSDKFSLLYAGKNSEKLISFCEQNNIKNVSILGKFNPSEILYYYEKIDIVNNLYGNYSPLLKYALSNKLYFAAQLHMPILVSNNTYMEKISIENGFGYIFDFNDEDAVNKLYQHYININWNLLSSNCNLFMDKVKVENEAFKTMVLSFYEEKNDA